MLWLIVVCMLIISFKMTRNVVQENANHVIVKLQ